jgi:hypothetical protein
LIACSAERGLHEKKGSVDSVFSFGTPYKSRWPLFWSPFALIAGFLLQLVSLVGGWVVLPFAWVTQQSIAMCEWVVHLADRMPRAYWYVPGVYGAPI